MKVLHFNPAKWLNLRLDYHRKMAVLSSVGDVKIVSSISTLIFVLNTLTLKYCAFIEASLSKRGQAQPRRQGACVMFRLLVYVRIVVTSMFAFMTE